MWLFVLFHRSEEILMTPQKKKGPELVGPIIWNDYLYNYVNQMLPKHLFIYWSDIPNAVQYTRTPPDFLVSLTLTFVWSGLVAYYKVDSSLVQRKAWAIPLSRTYHVWHGWQVTLALDLNPKAQRSKHLKLLNCCALIIVPLAPIINTSIPRLRFYMYSYKCYKKSYMRTCILRTYVLSYMYSYESLICGRL